VAFQPAGDFEFQQHRAHDRRRGARQPHQIVDRYRRRTQQADDARALVVVRLDVERERHARAPALANRSRGRGSVPAPRSRRPNARRRRSAAAAGECWQGFERGARRHNH
jgi:hypothetical protein